MQIQFRRNSGPSEWPAGNYIVIGLATVTFAIQMYGDPKAQYLNGLVLDHASFTSFFGYMWLHMSPIHIVGNLITLFIFGRYVSLKVGNANYPRLYVCPGFAAAAVHLIYDGRPTIGASGAIMEILGMHVLFCFNGLAHSGRGWCLSGSC